MSSIPGFNSTQVSNLMSLANSVENSEEVIFLTLPRLRLHIGEATLLYDHLMKVRVKKKGFKLGLGFGFGFESGGR